MADFSNAEKEEVVAKGIAKRKYLLVDNDLEGLEFELRDNPVNKSYAPMKIFKLSEVESLAITKWGSMEKLETEQEKRRQQTSELENRKEEEKRHFWDCKELFEPLKHFMVNMELPTERVSSYFKDKGDNRQATSGCLDSLFECDVILCFCDCLHSIPNDYFMAVLVGKLEKFKQHECWVAKLAIQEAGETVVARRIFKRFPEARQVDKETPYNERRKMGHFSWTSSLTSDQVIINLYVVHKWKGVSQRQASSVINFEVLSIGLQRLSALLSKTLENDGRQANSLSIGTYVPYRVDSETFKRTLEDNMEQPVRIFSNTN